MKKYLGLMEKSLPLITFIRRLLFITEELFIKFLKEKLASKRLFLSLERPPLMNNLYENDENFCIGGCDFDGKF